MEQNELSNVSQEMSTLCKVVRELVGRQDFKKCEDLICKAMGKYPHAPQPHNLTGILLEKKGDHSMAMKHFRAALTLDPTYEPARHNLDCYGTFFSSGRFAYDESDCCADEENNKIKYEIEYDAHGIGHMIRRNKT